MGRSTPPLRTAVREYVERLRKTSEVLPPQERLLVEKYLEDMETTVSAYMHTGAVDPLEVFLLHLIRRLGELCRQ